MQGGGHIEKVVSLRVEKTNKIMGKTSTYQASAAMSNLWNYLRGLSLSSEDRHWLADKLVENTEKKESKKAKDLVFPKIGADFKPSPEILAMSCGPLPEGFDIEKELDIMWEEWAK
jgi:hypothetical protein